MTVDHKIVLYGDYGVGKSCLISRLLDNTFNKFATPTIGSSFMFWRLPQKNKLEQTPTFGIWDTAGHERFSTLLPMYLRGADIILYCWDYNIPFDKTIADKRYDEAIRCSPHCHFYLVLTKTDLAENIEKSPAIERWLKDNKIQGCFYTSSLTGDSVENLFITAAHGVINNPPPKGPGGFQLPEDNSYTNSCCYGYA